MEAIKYPLGIQTFKKIREEGYTYIDKTKYILSLTADRQYVFLNRPRRFGKSLLLSTLHAYFEGQRELFKGLDIDSLDVDWTPSPVLHIDLNSGLYSDENGLIRRLDRSLSVLEEPYGISCENREASNLPIRFENVIKSAYEQTGKKVVILVDEYDKPLLEIEDNPALFKKNQAILKGFFGNLKSMDRYIRFAFLTGVARFNKVSIFSDVNHLDDISLTNEFADLCGWTEEELLGTFRSEIEALARENGKDFETTLSSLRDFYDGYKFAPKGSRLYNPYSVMKALKNRFMEPYWFETGTPSFLAKRVKNRDISLALTDDAYVYSREELSAVGLLSSDPGPLMFQTGYLTIKHYDPESELYELSFPNNEVRIGFSKNLLELYTADIASDSRVFSLSAFRHDLFTGHPERFMERLRTLFKDIPGEDHRESTYRAITYLLALLSGLTARAEHHSYRGRSDLEVETPRYIYLFEFKYNESVEAAMSQIHERDYAGRFLLDRRKVYLIGANLNSERSKRDLTYRIEEFKA